MRAQQGYSVWKGETFVVNGKQGGEKGGISNAGGDAWGAGGMYGELRPEFWAAIDEAYHILSAWNQEFLLLMLQHGADMEVCVSIH